MHCATKKRAPKNKQYFVALWLKVLWLNVVIMANCENKILATWRQVAPSGLI